jgi:hypothetical protein
MFKIPLCVFSMEGAFIYGAHSDQPFGDYTDDIAKELGVSSNAVYQTCFDVGAEECSSEDAPLASRVINAAGESTFVIQSEPGTFVSDIRLVADVTYPVLFANVDLKTKWGFDLVGRIKPNGGTQFIGYDDDQYDRLACLHARAMLSWLQNDTSVHELQSDYQKTSRREYQAG